MARSSIAVGIVDDVEWSFPAIDKDVLIGGPELSVEGDDDVGPLVGGELFLGLHHRDSGDPAGDNAELQMAVAETKVHPIATFIVACLSGNDRSLAGLGWLDPQRNGVTLQGRKDLETARAFLVLTERWSGIHRLAWKVSTLSGWR